MMMLLIRVFLASPGSPLPMATCLVRPEHPLLHGRFIGVPRVAHQRPAGVTMEESQIPSDSVKLRTRQKGVAVAVFSKEFEGEFMLKLARNSYLHPS